MIKTLPQLAEHIRGKRVLHMNSLGKDSAVCLEFLTRFAKPAHVTAVHFGFMAEHPGDAPYLRWQAKRYPQVEFVTRPNGNELTEIVRGTYQSPIDIMTEFNHWEYVDFFMEKQAEEVRQHYGCDFICIGNSMYESVARATKFHKNGLVTGVKIYPLGLMSKQEVIGCIRDYGIKVHPAYKLSQSTFDHPSYYKMRAAFIASPEYERTVMALYPLLRLDRYRYEKLFKEKQFADDAGGGR